VNRSSNFRTALPALGVLIVAVACGPRMKPVEYEEPSKDLSSSSGGDVDDTSSSKSTPSSSSASSDSSASSNSSASSDSSSGSNEGGAKKFVGACKEKKCGETCTECSPGDTSCMELLVLKQCNLKGACVPAPVDCSAPKKDKGKDDKGKDDKAKGKK
jgi:hypothetical protein